MTKLSEKERRDWLRLARTPNVGPVTFAALVARFGSAVAALDALPGLARRGGGSEIKLPQVAEIDREMESLAQLKGRFIASCEADFPPALAALDPPPPLIAVLGRPALLGRDMVAIVGARNASALGRKFAAQLAAGLGEAGLVIASGMARGIDTAAHAAALPFGTCAVLAGGVDVVYPPENKPLYEQMRADGALVSEMPVGESPQARHFPRRNRIISGLSRGTVVVEAAEGSGSLITARFALEQGREVFAVPGSPLDPRARGCNQLIRDGATLTGSVSDVLATLQPILERGFTEPESQLHLAGELRADDRDIDRIRMTLLELLSPSPVEMDELVRQSHAPSAVAAAALLELQVAGRVLRHPGNRFSLI